MKAKRRFPIGAEIVSSGVHFRVWAPACHSLEVVLQGKGSVSLKKEEEGYFSGLAKGAVAGDLYQFRLNESESLVPDPASRFQPEGPHGPSAIVDPSLFSWQDDSWKGLTSLKKQVLYEMHIGTFTEEGTWKAAIDKLAHLAELGVTLIEMMPIADFAGKCGWGYDGVNFFAPTHLYGSPEELREFINQSHLLGIGVILDVVYNHFGPDGNYIAQFSKDYFSEHHKTDWGAAINFDGEGSKGVREFFLTNASYWIDEFHFDGLRLDATQNIYDRSELHIIKEISLTLNKKSKQRKTLVIAENESQEIRFVEPFEEEGFGLAGVWNDDFHHASLVFLTGRKEAYYSDYLGSPQEFISLLKYGYLYQGQYYKWQKKKRGTPDLHIPSEKYINFLQNHDQIANLMKGQRLHEITHPAFLRLMTTLLLLSPQTPLLFQGQEFGASSPFYYFADHNAMISKHVWEGRKRFLAQFPSFNKPEMNSFYPDPGDWETFQKSKIIWDEKREKKHQEFYVLHYDLLQLRKNLDVFTNAEKIDGAVINSRCFLIRYFSDERDCLIIFNLGIDFPFTPTPEPLIAPPKGKKWRLLFSSEHPKYGGGGNPSFEEKEEWDIPGYSAVVFETLNI